MYYPHVIEKTGRSEKPIDLPSRMLQDRIVYFGTDFNEDSTNSIIMQLMWLDCDNDEADIDMYIKSPGGVCYDGLAVKDIMDKIRPKVNITATGCVASMGAYLLSCATGNRRATRNARIMIHSVSGGYGGTYHDAKVDFEEMKFLQKKLALDIANNSKGKSTLEDIEKYIERDYWMSAEEALKIGLIDEII